MRGEEEEFRDSLTMYFRPAEPPPHTDCLAAEPSEYNSAMAEAQAHRDDAGTLGFYSDATEGIDENQAKRNSEEQAKGPEPLDKEDDDTEKALADNSQS